MITKKKQNVCLILKLKLQKGKNPFNLKNQVKKRAKNECTIKNNIRKRVEKGFTTKNNIRR